MTFTQQQQNMNSYVYDSILQNGNSTSDRDATQQLSQMLQQFSVQQQASNYVNDAIFKELMSTYHTALASAPNLTHNPQQLIQPAGVGVGCPLYWQLQVLWQQQYNQYLQQLVTHENAAGFGVQHNLVNPTPTDNFSSDGAAQLLQYVYLQQLLQQQQQQQQQQQTFVLNGSQSSAQKGMNCMLPGSLGDNSSGINTTSNSNVQLALVSAKNQGKKTRLIWTEELNNLFIRVVEELGWKTALPRDILKRMNVTGLTRENVSSHLQKYRLKRKSGQKLVSTVYPKVLKVGKNSSEEDEVNSSPQSLQQRVLSCKNGKVESAGNSQEGVNSTQQLQFKFPPLPPKFNNVSS